MSAVPSPNLVGITGIARRLVQDGSLAETVARKAMADAAAAKMPLAHWLNEKRLVSPAQMAAANSVEFGIPLLDVAAFDPAHNAMKLVSEELLQKHMVLPLFKRGTRLYVGISDPTQTRALDEIKFHTNLIVEPILVAEDQLRRALDTWGNTSTGLDTGGDEEFGDLELAAGDEDGAGETGIDANKADEAPIVKFVNKMLLDAIRRGASDLHFEPYETEYRVRFRMDGLLHTVATTTPKLATRIAARLKVMAQLDIAEKRVPQDGRIKLNLSKTRQMDFRVSTLPTLFGEKVVLRILDGGAAKLGIDKLGYEDEQRALYEKALENPYGMILVTGPTGSGKTVSLYTGLNILNTQERNISTAEDPVEIRVPGINQVQINPKQNMTFAAALKSFLRQDPDVIMVGEIRDLETAEIAVKAAQTGHLVLSTLHTNDAPQTIDRLMNMGIPPFNLTSSITLVIAQRLARRLCPVCKVKANHAPDRLLAAGFSQAEIDAGMQIMEANPSGCPECNFGFKGRVGIYQVMPMTEEIKKIILARGNAVQIAEAAQASGVADLRMSALKKVKDGLISLAEADRVTLN